MINWPILSLITFLPLIGISFIFFIKYETLTVSKNISNVALLTSLTTFVLSLSLLFRFDFDDLNFQLVEQINFTEQEHYLLGIDGISLIFIIINSFLGMLVILALRDQSNFNQKGNMIALLLAVLLTNGMFCSIDLVWFNIFFFLFPLPFIFINKSNTVSSPNHQDKWFVFSFLISSMFFWLAVIGLKYVDNTDLEIKFIWFLMFLTLFFRLGLIPNHFWLTSFLKAQKFPIASYYLISLVFSIIHLGLRFMLPFTSYASAFWVIFIATLTIIYNSLSIIFEKNTFKFLSYIFGIYLGIVLIGLFSFSSVVLAGSIFIFIAFSCPFMVLQFEFNEHYNNEKRALDALRFFILPMIIILPPFAVFSGFILLISELIVQKMFLLLGIIVGAMLFSSIGILIKYKNIINTKILNKKDRIVFISLLLAIIFMAILQSEIFEIILNSSQIIINNVGVL